jgi:hypothetical protein
MSQDVTYNIKGTSDVPQQTEKAKAAMSDLDRQAAAINRKFSDVGKDLFMSFAAPMVLIHQAIGFIGDAIAKSRQDAKDAMDFAASVKLEDIDKSPVDKITRFMNQKLKVDLRSEKEVQQAETSKRKVVAAFLERDPRGQEYYRKNVGINDETGGFAMDEKSFAVFKGVQDDIMKMNEADMKKALADEMQKSQDEKNKKDPALFAGDNSTFGVGLSPQMNLLNQQVELQKQANEYLAIIANASGTTSDFTKDTSNGNASKNVYYDTTNVS